MSELAEALGESEETIILQIEESKKDLEAAGENTEDYFREVKSDEGIKFLIQSGGLTS